MRWIVVLLYNKMNGEICVLCVHRQTVLQCADDSKMDKYFNYILQLEALLTISKWIEVDLLFGFNVMYFVFWILNEWGDSGNVIVIYILVTTTGC